LQKKRRMRQDIVLKPTSDARVVLYLAKIAKTCEESEDAVLALAGRQAATARRS